MDDFDKWLNTSSVSWSNDLDLGKQAWAEAQQQAQDHEKVQNMLLACGHKRVNLDGNVCSACAHERAAVAQAQLDMAEAGKLHVEQSVEKSQVDTIDRCIQAAEIAGLGGVALRGVLLTLSPNPQAQQTSTNQFSVEQALVGQGSLVNAAKDLLEACYQADSREDLPHEIDGTKVDALRNALIGASNKCLDALQKAAVDQAVAVTVRRCVEVVEEVLHTQWPGLCELVVKAIHALRPDPDWLEQKELEVRMTEAKWWRKQVVYNGGASEIMDERIDDLKCRLAELATRK